VLQMQLGGLGRPRTRWRPATREGEAGGGTMN
jgi:hypothetical protein